MTRLALIAALVSSIALADSLGPVPGGGASLCTVANGYCDAGSYVLGGKSAIQTDYNGDLILSASGGPAYLIPESGTVYTHVNATDLNAGTALHGGAFTLNGSVTYNAAASPRPSVGPFSDSNYFSQPNSSPANVSTEPMTVVMIINDTSITTNQGVFETGAYGSGGGYGLFVSNYAGNTFAPYFSNSTEPITTVVTTGVVHVLFTGIDTSGVVYAQVDNNSLTTASGGTLTAGATNTFIGRGTSTGQSFSGLVYELLVSNSTPSNASFNAIYASILANESNPQVVATGNAIVDGGVTALGVTVQGQTATAGLDAGEVKP